MRDEGRRFAQQKYAETVKQLRAMYKEAGDDLRMKLASWEHAHEARVKKYRAQLRAGEITQADYEAWMRGQIFQREAWKKKQAQIAELMTDADAEALRLINDGKIEVFAENATFLGYQLEQEGGADYGFGVYNQRTVRRILRDDPKMLPEAKLNRHKDYAWYNRIIQQSVNQGILQGEDLEGIMLRILLDTNEKSMSALRRNAFTAYHSAQEAGVMEGMRNAARRGIQVQKRWNCQFLPNTREAHARLHGVIIDWDKDFDSQLGPIAYPGDPAARPENIWNCHCRIERINVKYPKADRGAQDKMRYDAWKRMKKGKRRGGD